MIFLIRVYPFVKLFHATNLLKEIFPFRESAEPIYLRRGDVTRGIVRTYVISKGNASPDVNQAPGVRKGRRERKRERGSPDAGNSEMGHKLICIQHSTCRSDERGRLETMPVGQCNTPSCIRCVFKEAFGASWHISIDFHGPNSSIYISRIVRSVDLLNKRWSLEWILRRPIPPQNFNSLHRDINIVLYTIIQLEINSINGSAKRKLRNNLL